MANYSEGDIQELYVAYFGRPAEPAGAWFWMGVANTQGIAFVADALGKSGEFTAQHAGRSNPELVNAVYRSLFNHDVATIAELQAWSAKLDSKELTPGQLVLAVIEQAKPADRIAYEAKVGVATLFGYSLDEASEVIGYSGTSAIAIVREYLDGVHDLPSMAAALQGMDALIDSLENPVVSAVPAAHDMAVLVGVEQAGDLSFF